MPYKLEIACFDVSSCIIAEEAGADRIEFCYDYPSGGITPPYSEILEVRKRVSIPLHVIIRPRARNFYYSPLEIKQMKEDVSFCLENKIDGVVFGALNKDQTVNKQVCNELMQLSGIMKTTFHRAIDETPDIHAAVADLVQLKFDKVLTSGTKSTALEGIHVLSELALQFTGKISIMPGGGIRSSNLAAILETTQCKEFHSAALNLNAMKADSEEIKRMKGLLTK